MKKWFPNILKRGRPDEQSDDRSEETRNTNADASYAEVDKVLRASAHPASAPDLEFRSKLLSELQSSAFTSTSMESVATETASNAWSWKKSWRELFATPVVRVSAGFAVLAIAVASTVNLWAPTAPTAPTPEQQVAITGRDLPQDPENAFKLVALEEKETGITPGTSFELKTTVDVSEEEVRKALRFEPAVAFTVIKTSSSAAATFSERMIALLGTKVHAAEGAENTPAATFTIRPDSAFLADTTVRATLALKYETENGTQPYTYSWSYQVEEKFQVVSTLPRDKAEYVPIDSGIEVTFSHVGFTGFEEAFSITPKIEGRFETHRNTAVFVPDDPLARSTYYEVRITKTVALPATGETLPEDVVFGFQTSSNEPDNGASLPENIRLQRTSLESSEIDQPTIELAMWGLPQDTEMRVKTYAFNSIDQFEQAWEAFSAIPDWARDAQMRWSYPTDGLQLTREMSLPAKELAQGWNYYVEFPESMPKGYYVVTVEHDGYAPATALLQVTNLTAFVSISATDTVVWANEAVSGDPLSNVGVRLSNGEELAVTGEDGLLRVTTPESLRDTDGRAPTLLLDNGGSRLYTKINETDSWFSGYDCQAEESYGFSWMGEYSPGACVNGVWSYLYTDRPFYSRNDTVKFWGVIESRKGEEISEALVQFSDAQYDRKGGLLHEQRVKVGKHGVFEGELPLSGVDGVLSIVHNDQAVWSKNITIAEYDKPAYQIKVTPEILGAIHGQTVTQEIKATLFDGTPVANMKLRIDKEVVTTNDVGIVMHKTEVKNEERQPISISYGVWPEKTEEGDMLANGSIFAFPSSQLLKVDTTTEGPKATVKGTLHDLDLEGYNRGDYPRYQHPYGDVVSDYPVSIRVNRVWQEKIETGTTYDFIQKKNVPQYRYENKSEKAYSAEAETNGNGEYSYSFDMDGTSSYEIRVIAIDSEDRHVEVGDWVSKAGADYLNNSVSFSMFAENHPREWDRQMSVGERVNTVFYRNDDVVAPDANDRFLFLKAQEGIRDARVSDTNGYGVTFGEDDIPSVLIQGVWFDGRSYWPSSPASSAWWGSGLTLEYKRSEALLSIDVETDQETYGPGDEVTLDLAVTNPDGDGQSAVINLNLVDEAIYAIQNEDVKFQDSLYHTVSPGIYAQRGSHVTPNPYFAADGFGGGGKEPPRGKLLDTALFRTVETDENGRAQVKFTLPDNLTSWRITTHALGDDHYAGNSVSKIVVSRPLIVDTVMSKFYLTGDVPTLKVRTYGTGIEDDSRVEFSVESESLDVDEERDATGFDVVTIPLPKLETPGEYKVTIRAKSGELEDAIERTLKVESSYFKAPVIERQDVTAGWKPNVESDEPVEVTLLDQNAGKFYEDLLGMNWSFGNRLDQRVTRSAATETLNQYFAHYAVADPLDAISYQHPESGALTLFPYSDSDLSLSADIAASSQAGAFGKDGLIRYFNATLRDSSQTTLRHAQSLYGLASLHEPVQYEIEQVLASDKITDQDRLYLALAFANLGDLERAREIWEPLMTAYVREMENVEPTLLMDLGASGDEKISSTLLSATIAARVQDDRADALYNYARAHDATSTVLSVQKMNFLEARMPSIPTSPVTITYQHLGEARTVTLEHGESFRLTLTSDALKEFVVQTVDGNAVAIVKYFVANAAPQIDPRISVTRTYEKMDVPDGEAILVTLKHKIADDAPEGLYQITDIIPAGFRLATGQRTWERKDINNYPTDQVGPRVNFYVSREYREPVKYLIRSANLGTFTAEHPLLQSLQAPTVQALGESQTLTVQ